MSRPALHAVLTALLVVSAGCAFGATTEATLSAEELTADEVVESVTADPAPDARTALTRAVENGTAETVGWQAIERRRTAPDERFPYLEHEGVYYRVNRTAADETTVDRPTVGAVRVNDTDVDAVGVADLADVDRRAAGLAVRLARTRAEEGGSLDDPRFRAPVHRAANESAIVAGELTHVRLREDVYRLDVRRQSVTATRYVYRAERVGDAGTLRERVTRPVPSNLTDAERDLLERVLSGENHTVDLTRETETPRALTTLAGKLGLPAPRDTVYQAPTVVYVRHEGDFYRLRLDGRTTAA